MRFDPSQMTPEQIAAANAKHMQSMLGGLQKPDKDPYAGTGLAGTAGIKGQQLSGISDLGYEPEFVPPQELNYISDLGYEPEPPVNQNLQSIIDSLGPPRTANTGNSTGALGINPDTGDTFLPDSQPQIGDPIPPGFLDGLISDDAGFFGGQGPGQPPTFRPPPSLSPFGNSIRPQQQFNPYGGGFGGGFPPRNPYGTGGIGGFFSQFGQQPSYGGGFGGQRFQPPMMPQQQFNPYGGGFGGQRFQPPRMPQQQFNPYGGGFGGQRFQPPRMPQQQFNPYGGGFGGQRFQPPMMPQQQFNQFGGGFGGFNQAPNPYGGRQFMNPQILPFNMQPMTGTTMRDLKFGPPPSQQVRMDQPILQSGVTQGPFGLNSNSDVLVGNPLQGGGMMATTNPDGTTTIGAGRMAAPGTNMATGQAPETASYVSSPEIDAPQAPASMF